jgi:hypothetical protein
MQNFLLINKMSTKLSMPTKQTLRYERKYILENPFLHNLEAHLLIHPAGFLKSYPQRQVNSLYYDSPTLKNYHASINGEYNRVKPRVRWYGPNTNKTTSGQLELKIKTGELGYKKILPLKNSKPILKDLIPTLLTSYTRQYYISANKKVRLTIDQNISYTNFLNQLKETATNPQTIIEIKYPVEARQYAISVPQFLPLTLNRMSKYVAGIDLFLK